MSSKALAPTAALAEAAQAPTPLERSAAILMAAGYRIVPLLNPVGPWQILGMSPQGLVLCAVVPDFQHLGVLYGAPAGWPHFTRRILHRYPAGADWPEALAL